MNYSVDNIHKICEVYGITNYTINADGSIDVDGDVDLWSRGLSELPVKFNHVSGDFYCHYNKLTTLLGSPQSVGGNFECSFNNLTKLDGSPERVGSHFYCDYNNLTTLEGGPQSVGNFICSGNNLTTLEFTPNSIGGYFDFSYNPIYDELGDIDYNSYIKQLNRDKILNELLSR
jgi:hypothetical protein